MAGLDEEQVRTLVNRLGGGLVSPGEVDQMVEEEVLTATEAEEVELTFQLSTQTGFTLKCCSARIQPDHLKSSYLSSSSSSRVVRR